MIKDLLSLIFPRCCVITHTALVKGEQYISVNCAHQLPKYDLNIPNENLHKRFYGLITIKHAFAYYKFSKNSNTRKLLHHLKYGNCPELGEITGKWYGQALIEAGYKAGFFDLIVPIPMHKVKQRKRGYNQCDGIARGLAAVLEIPWASDVLEKKVNTQTQTRKNRMERFDNANSVYGIKNKEVVKGKRILLVDDVITTGATISMCAHLLLENGCQEVSVAALATE